MAVSPVAVSHDGDSILVQATIQPAHFTIQTRFGYNPLLICPCSATLELDYSNDNGGIVVMTRRLAVFLDEHEGCEVL